MSSFSAISYLRAISEASLRLEVRWLLAYILATYEGGLHDNRDDVLLRKVDLLQLTAAFNRPAQWVLEALEEAKAEGLVLWEQHQGPVMLHVLLGEPSFTTMGKMVFPADQQEVNP